MAKTSSEIFNGKVNLIYEYNRQSPLFVRRANTEIENKNPVTAIEILQNGLKNYPYYPAAYLLLGKAYTRTGNFPAALQAIKKGSGLISSKKTYEYYLNEIEAAKKDGSIFNGTSHTVFDAGDEPSLFVEEKEKPLKLFSVEEQLGKLAEQFEDININPSRKEDENEDISSPSMIVSETLAKIYIAQGEIKEAVDVFRKLIIKNPAKKDYYLSRIEELNSNSQF